MEDNQIQQAMSTSDLGDQVAPRVTLQDIEACIAYEYYTTGDRAFEFTTSVLGPAYKEIESADITPLRCLTLCVLHLKNGFLVTGESAGVSVENFNAETGRRIAREKALDKLWALEGYLLKERLYRYSSGTANSVP